MADTLQYGIIGCGMMGQEHIRNIAFLPDVNVAAICDPDVGMRERSRQLAPEAAIVDTLDAVLDMPALGGLVVASPNHLHVDHLERISSRRPLPTLVEKPLYTVPEDAARIAALQSHPAPVWVGMAYRYMPPIASLVEQAEAVTGGVRMLSIREHRFPFLRKVNDWNRFNANTGGTMVEKCCHFFDLMRLILKSEPVRVMASAGQEVNHSDEIIDGQRPDIWDCGYVLVDFESGARAMLELCMFADGSRYQSEISAVGPNGKIECRIPGAHRLLPTEDGACDSPLLIVSPRHGGAAEVHKIPIAPELLAAGSHNGATYYQHVRFASVARGEAAPEVTLDDGALAVSIGLAAQRSAEAGNAVPIGSQN